MFWAREKGACPMRASPLTVLSTVEAEGIDGYKPSLYNLFVDKGELVWGINFRSLALIRLDRDRYQQAQRILAGELLSTDSNRALRDDLIKGKFLIPQSLDEIELLRTKHWSARFGE